MSNQYTQFFDLFPKDELAVGQVITQYADGTSLLEMPAGGQVIVRGTTVAVGKNAFIQQGEIKGEAPNLNVIEIEV